MSDALLAVSLPLLTGQLIPGEILRWIIIAIVVMAAIGILYAVARHFGVEIPPVIVLIFWIVVVAAVAIIAIKLLAGL